MEDLQQRLAQERTATAYERTMLAQERTFSAWIRTGLASIVTGLALVKLMVEAQPAWLTQALGIVFVAAGAVMFGLAYWTYGRARRPLAETVARGVPAPILICVTIALTLAAAATLVLVVNN